MPKFTCTLTLDPRSGSRTSFKCPNCNTRLQIHWNPVESLGAVLACPKCFALQEDGPPAPSIIPKLHTHTLSTQDGGAVDGAPAAPLSGPPSNGTVPKPKKSPTVH